MGTATYIAVSLGVMLKHLLPVLKHLLPVLKHIKYFRIALYKSYACHHLTVECLYSPYQVLLMRWCGITITGCLAMTPKAALPPNLYIILSYFRFTLERRSENWKKNKPCPATKGRWDFPSRMWVCQSMPAAHRQYSSVVAEELNISEYFLLLRALG